MVVCAACLAGRAYLCTRVTMRGTPGFTGAYAEYTRVGAAETLRLPAAVTFHHGALVEPLAVGLNAVGKARLEAGDTVLIIGAGPVGLSVALWCRFFGAHHIIVSDLVKGRAERALALGATAAVDASREDVGSRVQEIGGGPARIVFDCVGVPGSLQLAIDHAPEDGRVVVVGLCMAADTIFPAKAITKELELGFVFVYTKHHFEIVVDMLGRERIDPLAMVTGCVGLEALPETFEALKTPTDQVKVMVEPG